MSNKIICVPAALIAITASVAHGQVSMPWFTLDGGGGASTGGTFSLRGTIGQTDAGAMVAGPFKMTGGFWALPQAVNPPDGPKLFINLGAPGFVVLSWLPQTSGFVLQSANALLSPGWTNIPSATNGMSIPATSAARFYRLQKP